MIPHKREDEKAKKIILKGDSETYKGKSYKKYPRHEITRKMIQIEIIKTIYTKIKTEQIGEYNCVNKLHKVSNIK